MEKTVKKKPGGGTGAKGQLVPRTIGQPGQARQGARGKRMQCISKFKEYHE